MSMTEYESTEWFPLKKCCAGCGKDKPLNDFDIMLKEQPQHLLKKFHCVNIVLLPNTIDWLKQYLNNKIYWLSWGNKSYNEIGISASIRSRIEHNVTLGEYLECEDDGVIWRMENHEESLPCLAFMNIELVNELTSILSKILESGGVNP